MPTIAIRNKATSLRRLLEQYKRSGTQVFAFPVRTDDLMHAVVLALQMEGSEIPTVIVDDMRRVDDSTAVALPQSPSFA